MNAVLIAAWPRGTTWARRYGLPLAGAAVLGAYLLLDAGWREAAKAALVFLLGGYPLLRLAHPVAQRIGYRLWCAAFAVDLALKGFLIALYQTKPDTVLVLDAIGNTSVDESLEFFNQYGLLIAQFLLAGLLLFAALLYLRADGERLRHARARWAVGLLVIFVGLHANPTFRRANPLLFWPNQLTQYQRFQDKIEQIDEKRLLAERKLPEWQPTYVGPARNTVVLVIGESTNRWNWQLYGYPRATTPQLLRETADAVVFQDVISGASGTVASFRLMLTPAEVDRPLDDEAEPSVLLLAKAAGYKTYWISNQHDRYINPRFAAEADVVRIVNSGGSRGDRKLDEGVLPPWEEALRDDAPRKLIVVHLLGAHPHYEMRSPPEYKRFSGIDDPVIEQMRKDERSTWVRLQRNSYDNAMLYQDAVIARLLRSFKADDDSGSGAFLYTSDHAQEVGHTRDFAGHTLSEPGVTVPFFVWLSKAPDARTDAQLEGRPFQTDLLDWTVLDLARIRTRFDVPHLALLGEQFRPQTRFVGDLPYTPSRRRHD
ncbi:phosphoethanolamine transferase [Solimonas variicoloris]|uniref:phosphoethanolamine transferase n=1 Tax=Solimonas variicoloris TaxID=254408 RepID=UPI0003AAAA8E|nr:phosphoethanolamine transferase [Solimonas variicoloris]